LNKLSLDNNLTDIDEEDDENKSNFGKEQDSMNKKKSSVDEETIRKRESGGLISILEVTEFSIEASTIGQNPMQESIKTEEDGVDGLYSNESQDNHNVFSSAGLKSSLKSGDSKLKQIEDEI